jgi:hypothetical protein
MTKATLTKVPTDIHKRLWIVKKNHPEFDGLTLFALYRKVLLAGLRALNLSGNIKS